MHKHTLNSKFLEMQWEIYNRYFSRKIELIDKIEEIKQYKQYSLAFQDLKNGRIDAIVMDKLPALMMLNLIG